LSMGLDGTGGGGRSVNALFRWLVVVWYKPGT
jgi:hypothetical protein